MGVQERMQVTRSRVDQGVRRINGDELAQFFENIQRCHKGQEITFLCIGTDRSTGDALGPLVGSSLIQAGLNSVIGSLEHPCDRDNLKQRIAEIPSGNIVVAIDACLGSILSQGQYLVSDQPLVPAEAVDGNLPAVGHYSVAAVVNVKSAKPYSTLQTTSLLSVMGMANDIVQAVNNTMMERKG